MGFDCKSLSFAMTPEPCHGLRLQTPELCRHGLRPWTLSLAIILEPCHGLRPQTPEMGGALGSLTMTFEPCHDGLRPSTFEPCHDTRALL